MSKGSDSAGLMQFGKHAYTEPLDEAKRCRKECALFDFSFVRRAALRGVNAVKVLHRFQSRNLDSMRVGGICYSVRSDDTANNFAVKSDLTIWRIADCSYEIYSGLPQDILDLERMSAGNAEFHDLSENTWIFSVQGPASLDALKNLSVSPSLTKLPYFGFQSDYLCGFECLIGRLGYTGEAGFEIVMESADSARQLWKELVKVGSPAGMIAADILRIEAGFILFLNECRLQANALELGMGSYATKSVTSYLPPSNKQLICFQCECDFEILPFSAVRNLSAPKDGEIAVTSVNRTQFSDQALGFGFVNTRDLAKEQYHDPRGWFHQIKRTSRPFYDTKKQKPRQPWR